jgi:hypothetical protein
MAVRSHPLLFLIVPMGFLGTGFAFFLRAKASVIAQGRWISFGSTLMSPCERRRYRWGYAMMGSGAVSALSYLF